MPNDLRRFSNCISILFIVTGIRHTLAQRSPTISYISPERIVDVGGIVDLSCSAQYVESYQILWIKYDPLQPRGSDVTISSKSILLIQDSRFSIRHNEETSTYTLQIKDIQETDAGIYQCQVPTSVHNKISAEVRVLVRRPPVISDNSTRSVIVSEGQSVKLECYASGFPLPKITWRRENNAILPTGGSIFRGNTLLINSVRKEDRGTYYCVADNGVEKGVKRNIAVEVEFAPVVSVPRPRLAQALDYDMDLECEVEAYPSPSISWHKDGFQLSNNQHYKLSNFATEDHITSTTLRVITIEKKQYGYYTCKASNKLGTQEGKVNLFETVTPVCPPACGHNLYGGTIPVGASLFVIFLAVVFVMFSHY